MTRNPFDALCGDVTVRNLGTTTVYFGRRGSAVESIPPGKSASMSVGAATDRAKVSRAMPGWGEETWQDGRIQNGEWP